MSSGQNEFFDITFLTHDTIVHTAVLKIYSNDTDEPVVTYNISGKAYVPKMLLYSNTPFFNSIGNTGVNNLGNISFGDSANYNFSVSNIGMGNLKLRDIRVVSGSSDFKIDTTNGFVSKLWNNEYKNFNITFKPTSLGTKTTTFEIINNSYSVDSIFQFSLTSICVDEPEINIRQDTIDNISQAYLFGYVNNGTTKIVEFTIENKAFKELEIFSVKFSQPSIAYVIDTSNLSHNISSFGSTTFTITYAPINNTISDAYLRIISNDSDEDTINLYLLGSGVTAVLNGNMIINNIINVFPNPASQNINIHSAYNIEQIRVIDVLGNEVMNVTKSGNTQFDISSLPKGLYNFVITTDRGTGSKKINIQ